MISSSQVNCTGTHLRRTYPSDSEARPVGMSKTGCYRKFWSQSTAMIDYEFGSPFIASLLGESANWPAAGAPAFGSTGCSLARHFGIFGLGERL